MNIELTLATLATLEWSKVGLTLLITLVIATVILNAIAPSPSPATSLTTQTPAKPARPGDLQTGLGALIALVSLVAGVYIFMFYDVTVDTARGGSVINFAKNSERMILLGACGVGVIVGTLMGVVGTMRQGK